MTSSLLGMPADIWYNCAIAVDIALLTIRDRALNVLLINRSTAEPGQLALPGGSHAHGTAARWLSPDPQR